MAAQAGDNRAEFARLVESAEACQRESGEIVQPPASESELAALSSTSDDVLGALPPEAFLEFLRGRNGMSSNGLNVYATMPAGGGEALPDFIAEFIDMNQVWRDIPDMREYLVFADGNMDLYGLHIRSGEFHSLDRVGGNITGRYPTFEALLVAALKSHN